MNEDELREAFNETLIPLLERYQLVDYSVEWFTGIWGLAIGFLLTMIYIGFGIVLIRIGWSLLRPNNAEAKSSARSNAWTLVRLYLYFLLAELIAPLLFLTVMLLSTLIVRGELLLIAEALDIAISDPSGGGWRELWDTVISVFTAGVTGLPFFSIDGFIPSVNGLFSSLLVAATILGAQVLPYPALIILVLVLTVTAFNGRVPQATTRFAVKLMVGTALLVPLSGAIMLVMVLVHAAWINSVGSTGFLWGVAQFILLLIMSVIAVAILRGVARSERLNSLANALDLKGVITQEVSRTSYRDRVANTQIEKLKLSTESPPDEEAGVIERTSGTIAATAAASGAPQVAAVSGTISQMAGSRRKKRASKQSMQGAVRASEIMTTSDDNSAGDSASSAAQSSNEDEEVRAKDDNQEGGS